MILHVRKQEQQARVSLSRVVTYASTTLVRILNTRPTNQSRPARPALLAHLLVAAHEEVVRHVSVPGESLEVNSRGIRVPVTTNEDRSYIHIYIYYYLFFWGGEQGTGATEWTLQIL